MISKQFLINLVSSAPPCQPFKLFSLLASAIFILSSCSPAEKIEPKFTITQAQKRFEDKCIKDFNLHVRTHQIGHTLWVYLPIKNPIFDYEVQKEKKTNEATDKPSFIVSFSDGKYQNNIFSFEYDIVDKKKSKDDGPGFNSSYTDIYTRTQTNLLTAIYEIFLNAKTQKDEQPIQFFVITITDIKKGIETHLTFYMQDFMRAWSGDIPNDEYMKRVLSDQKGSPSMIGDETGSHLKYEDITMGDFLTKQILNRIRLKFQYSDFPPKDNNFDNTVIGIVADTVKYYKFEDFTNVRLNNLRSVKKYLFDKSQLVNFGEEKPKENAGRLIHIRFKDGKPEFNEDNSSQTNQSF